MDDDTQIGKKQDGLVHDVAISQFGVATSLNVAHGPDFGSVAEGTLLFVGLIFCVHLV